MGKEYHRNPKRHVTPAMSKLAKHLSTRSVRLARMILIQANRNAMVNDLVVRNVADLAAVPAGKPGRPSRSLNLEQAASWAAKTLTDWRIKLMNSGNSGD
jgi:hypothetical protein